MGNSVFRAENGASVQEQEKLRSDYVYFPELFNGNQPGAFVQVLERDNSLDYLALPYVFFARSCSQEQARDLILKRFQDYSVLPDIEKSKQRGFSQLFFMRVVLGSLSEREALQLAQRIQEEIAEAYAYDIYVPLNDDGNIQSRDQLIKKTIAKWRGMGFVYSAVKTAATQNTMIVFERAAL